MAAARQARGVGDPGGAFGVGGGGGEARGSVPVVVVGAGAAGVVCAGAVVEVVDAGVLDVERARLLRLTTLLLTTPLLATLLPVDPDEAVTPAFLTAFDGVDTLAVFDACVLEPQAATPSINRSAAVVRRHATQFLAREACAVSNLSRCMAIGRRTQARAARGGR